MSQCRGCEWDGTGNHCSACHCTFGGLEAFDSHHEGSIAHNTRHCVRPSDLGLVLDGSVWRTPEGRANTARLRVHMIKIRKQRGAPR